MLTLLFVVHIFINHDGFFSHIRLSYQHEQAQRLCVCAFIQRQINPQLVYVCRPRSFLKHYLFIIYDIILTAFLIIFRTWLYNKLMLYSALLECYRYRSGNLYNTRGTCTR